MDFVSPSNMDGLQRQRKGLSIRLEQIFVQPFL